MRKLEIGPGSKHLKGYETVGMEFAQTKHDVRERLPYDDNTFDEVLASHVIEHIEWYKTQEVLTDWVRILKPGGILKVWTPDVNRIMNVVFAAENGESFPPEVLDAHVNMLKKHNKDNDPYIWANYRIMSAENPKAAIQFNKPHRSFFTYGHLYNQMSKTGLKNIHRISERPPYDHGWANMGVQGIK